MNVQVLADPLGRLIWASPALPGAVHDLTAARRYGIIDALADAGVRVRADKGYQGAGGTVTVPYRGRWSTPSEGNGAVNRSHATIRAVGEQPTPRSRPGACRAGRAARPEGPHPSSKPCSAFTSQRRLPHGLRGKSIREQDAASFALRARWQDEWVAQPLQPSPNLFSALTRARVVAEEHMIGADRVGISWREETVSELLWVNAQPFVKCADFARQEENVVGADWLWWWVDDAGECFGMLVQAKRLHHRDGQPQLDFRHNGGQQMVRLFSTAEQLQVPAVYALYFGGIEFRRMACSEKHTSDCGRCRRASVSLITAIQAELASLGSLRDAANLAFQTSMPLEDLVNPASTGPVHDFNLDAVGPALREFMLQEQTGARQVARQLFRIVSADRAMQFSTDVADRMVTAVDTVFTDLPPDRGHFSEPYFRHVLRGLRTGVPDYVHDVLTGQSPPPTVTRAVDGIVVVRC